MPKGYIYVLSNPSIPGKVKIGMTTRSPDERAAELSTATGIPTKFAVVFSLLVDDCEKAEKLVFSELESQGLRTSPDREFFECGQEIAIYNIYKKLKADIDLPKPRNEIQSEAKIRAFLETFDLAPADFWGKIRERYKLIANFSGHMADAQIKRLMGLRTTDGSIPRIDGIGTFLFFDFNLAFLNRHRIEPFGAACIFKYFSDIAWPAYRDILELGISQGHIDFLKEAHSNIHRVYILSERGGVLSQPNPPRSRKEIFDFLSTVRDFRDRATALGMLAELWDADGRVQFDPDPLCQALRMHLENQEDDENIENFSTAKLSRAQDVIHCLRSLARHDEMDRAREFDATIINLAKTNHMFRDNLRYAIGKIIPEQSHSERLRSGITDRTICLHLLDLLGRDCAN